jgi:hypothetical protein
VIVSAPIEVLVGVFESSCGRSRKASLVDCSWLVDSHLVLVVQQACDVY